jgi:predicted dehydrogenase
MEMRVILSGCGTFGSVYRQRIVEHKDYELVCVVDKDARILTTQTSGVIGTKTLEEAVSNVDADAVIITSPTGTHAEAAKYCLENNLHVLCAKPGPQSIEQANTLAHLSELHSRACVVDYTMLNTPEVDYIHMVFAAYNAPHFMTSLRDVMGPPRPEGAVWDLLSHDVATFCEFMPRSIVVSSVKCVANRRGVTAKLLCGDTLVGELEAEYACDAPLKRVSFAIASKTTMLNPVVKLTWNQNFRDVTTRAEGAQKAFQEFGKWPDPITLALDNFVFETETIGHEFYLPVASLRMQDVTRVLVALQESFENDGLEQTVEV